MFAPAADAAIPNGAQTVWFYKTNNSTRAELALTSAYGTIQSEEWGIGGNRITYTNTLVAETSATVAGVAFDEAAAGTAGTTFSMTVDGGAANVFTTPGSVTDNASLVTAIADAGNWSAGAPTGASATVGGADGASTITVAQDADVAAHTNGWGHSFELVVVADGDMGLNSGLYLPATESQASITIDQKRDQLKEEEVLGGTIAIRIGSTNTNSTVTVTDTDVELYEGGSLTYSFVKASFSTLKDLVDEINLATYAGWSAAIGDTQLNSRPISVLDEVSSVGADSATELPARLKFDATLVQSFFNDSALTNLKSPSATGLPDAQAEIGLASGTRGLTTGADIIAALEQFTKFHVNFVVPLFSRDATDDIADSLTDSGSTYTIDGVHQAVKTHISLMKTVKRKSERQGYLSQKASFNTCRDKAGVLADARIQLLFQDVRQTDSEGTIKWFQPWALAALTAGARGGAAIGEPLTFKFLNVAGIRQTAQPMNTPDADINIDFDPDLQAEEAIIAGMTFLESPTTGGFRVVVDNTTYGRDGNWVLNRANVIYAGDIVAFNFRNTMEAAFIGKKNTVSVADVNSVATSTLNQFLAQGITVSTGDAPQGYKSLISVINGNVIEIEFTVKLVEGIDFVITEITVQRATQA